MLHNVADVENYCIQNKIKVIHNDTKYPWLYTTLYINFEQKTERGNLHYASVEVSFVPACCGELFISNLKVQGWRIGHGTDLIKHIYKIAELGGYTRISGIVPRGYECANNFFKKLGWKIAKDMTYINKRTNNTLYRYIKNI